MQRVSGPGRRLAILHVAVALLIQFAPSIHVFGAHHHESTSCKHGAATHFKHGVATHFETDTSGAIDAPCLICAQLLSGHALADAVGADSDRVLTLAGNFPPFALHPGKPALELPDNRGPPHPL